MGIRINKFLGYGFVFDNNENVINPDRNKEISKNDYANFLVNKYEGHDSPNEDFYFVDVARTDERLSRHVVKLGDLDHDRSVLIIVPMTGWDKWVRGDDDIDYYEFILKNVQGREEASFSPEVSELNNGIFPFDGMYMDSRNGESFPYSFSFDLSLVRNAKEENTKTIEWFEEKYLPVNELNFVVPTVPQSVKDIVECSEILFNPHDILRFRPIIATLWE